MSHVATVELEVRDLSALAEACSALGMELIPHQQAYRCWYTNDWGSDAERDKAMRQLGFTPNSLAPEGFTVADLGRCEHAIRIINDATGDAYEIGVVARRDGRAGFTLLWDSWDDVLKNQVGGAKANRLRQEYGLVVAKRQALRAGFRVHEQRQPNGTIQVRLTR